MDSKVGNEKIRDLLLSFELARTLTHGLSFSSIHESPNHFTNTNDTWYGSSAVCAA
jgi:hypothetical protein